MQEDLKKIPQKFENSHRTAIIMVGIFYSS